MPKLHSLKVAGAGVQGLVCIEMGATESTEVLPPAAAVVVPEKKKVRNTRVSLEYIEEDVKVFVF